MIKKSEVIKALRDCYDPCCRDRGISVVDMGLIENVKVKGRKVYIEILLTTGWCPSVSILFQMMKERVEQFDQVDEVDVNVAVSYTHRRCRRSTLCRSRWSPYH